MITEIVERVQGNRIDGVGADQLFHVQRVTILGIFGAGGSPQRPLNFGALLLELLPAVAGEYPVELLVREFGVGDGGLSHQTFDFLLASRVRGRCRQLLQLLIDGTIDLTDKKLATEAMR